MHIDKSSWPRGPWQTEADDLEWRTTSGLRAVILRNPFFGTLCGYVAIPPSHGLHGVSYEKAPLSAHGGLTYASHTPPRDHETDEKLWWFGFDACHSCDYAPGLAQLRHAYMSRDLPYRDVAYMRRECEKLAAQLKLKEKENGGNHHAALER